MYIYVCLYGYLCDTHRNWLHIYIYTHIYIYISTTPPDPPPRRQQMYIYIYTYIYVYMYIFRFNRFRQSYIDTCGHLCIQITSPNRFNMFYRFYQIREMWCGPYYCISAETGRGPILFFGKSRSRAGKRLPGPIWAGPRRKDSMDAGSLAQDLSEYDLLVRTTIVKPGLSLSFRFAWGGGGGRLEYYIHIYIHIYICTLYLLPPA